MLCSHTPLRRFERTLPSRAGPQGRRDPRPKLIKLPGFAGYYLIDAGTSSSARSVSLRRLNRARSPQVVALRANPVLVAA